MKIQCPQCGVAGSVDEAYRGKKVKCPKCNMIFVVAAAFEGDSPPLPLAAVPSPASLADEPAAIETVPAVSAQIDTVETEAMPSPGDDGEGVAPASPAADDTPVTLSDGPSGEPLPEMEERLEWADIVSEMDKGDADESKRGREEDAAPASLDEPLTTNVEPEVGGATGAEGGEAVVAEPPPAPGLGMELPLAAAVTAAALASEDKQDQPAAKIVLDGVEQSPYGVEKEQCWQCGKKDSVGVPFIAKDGRLYCADCLPGEPKEPPPVEPKREADASQPRYDFTIGGLLREAWAKTKGVKGAIWAGSALMYVAMIVIIAGGAMVLPQSGGDGWNPLAMVSDVLFQLFSNAVMVVFSAGIINIGIRRLAGETVGWKMVFDGIPVAGKLIVAGILQTLLIMIGFLLLILPGIYLSVGYCMTIPLIVDRRMSPWQAMEASRKAVHGEWWKIFGLFLVMGVIVFLASLPLGLGLIWVWPMFVVCGALVYRTLFGIERKAD
jgi:hypothetical protein